ncbi:MAG: hypothetical protein LBQ16_02840 [Gracilibacteraceae bacterium]|jgi:hypothetical protein|nr:hypothetical protein [Gracilibacteraceae bacterium]
MRKKSFVFWAALVLLPAVLAACGQGGDTAPPRETVTNERETLTESGTPNVSENFIRCVVSGDIGGSYEGTGEDGASWGCFFREGDHLPVFVLVLRDDKDEKVKISAGVLNLNIEAKGEQMGDLASVADFNTDSFEWESNYASQFRSVAYDASENSDDSRVRVTLTRSEKLDGGYLRLAGSFSFKASNLPTNIPEAAALDAWNHSDRKPPYDPALLGTSDIVVSGTFDITQLLELNGW